MLPLIISPAKILRTVAQAVKVPINENVKTLARDMILAMQHYNGIGLAGPQVNVSDRVIVISTADGPTAFINPIIKKCSILKISMEEGCLSIPGIFGLVRRPKKILVQHLLIDGSEENKWIDGLLARVYQHEVDHLDGILFTDRAHKITGGHELLEKYGIKK